MVLTLGLLGIGGRWWLELEPLAGNWAGLSCTARAVGLLCPFLSTWLAGASSQQVASGELDTDMAASFPRGTVPRHRKWKLLGCKAGPGTCMGSHPRGGNMDPYLMIGRE